MAKKVLEKHYRKGMTFMELLDKFSDDRTAEEWFIHTRWSNGIKCPSCNSDNIYIRPEEKRRNQPYRCRSCRSDFSVKSGTLMQSSHIGYRAWAVVVYLMTTNLKGISSMKLHRGLGITQKSAWLMMHKIRETFDDETQELFGGQVEVDETYLGGKEKNKYKSKKLNAGRGTVGKTAVIGVKERGTNKVSASPIASTDTTLYTDSATAYIGVTEKHETVNHSVGEFVKEQTHTNGIESFWALLKHIYYGTYHRMSEKHLARYVNESAGQHNIRSKDTVEQMNSIARGIIGNQLIYSRELVK